MPSITVTNLPDATHRALMLRAAQHGRSIEAEIHFILEAAVARKVGLCPGTDWPQPARCRYRRGAGLET